MRNYLPSDYNNLMLLNDEWKKTTGQKYKLIFDTVYYPEILKHHDQLQQHVSLVEIDSRIVGMISGGVLPKGQSCACLRKALIEFEWSFRETTYPLGLLSSYVYGLFPIVPIWILKYTYQRFWLFIVVEVVANIIFVYLVLTWFARRGIVDYNAGLAVFIAATLISLLMYGFQMWQETPVNK